jgi:hypothetical protein
MRTCRLCKDMTVLDDIVLSLATGYCICLRCYSRETDSVRVLSPSLRRALGAA